MPEEGKEYLMAVDAGTGSCRAVIFDAQGNQASLSQQEWSHPSLPGVPGSQVFETEGNWKMISSCVRESISSKGIRPSRIKAVCATSMREGMVLYDSQRREIWACPNVDSRAVSEAARLVRKGLARKIYFTGGDWVSITAPPRFLWISRHEPETFRRIAHVTMLSDWIVFRLTGKFVTDPSVGSSSGMFDLRKRTWSQQTLEICGLTEGVFPDVAESGTVVGGVTREAARETGLNESTPVVVGGADTQLGLVGIGVTKPNRVTVVGGTFWQHTVLLDRPLVDPRIRLRTLCHSISDQWMMEGIGFYCGLVMRWFRDAFCKPEKEEAQKTNTDAYELMERQASLAPPGSNGVLGVFSNIMDSKRWTHASPSFLQFDITHPERSGKKECIRAIEESAAYVSLGHHRIIESLVHRRVREVVFTGGGSKGSLWPQIVADVLGARVSVPVVRESTSLGAAIYAGLGAGIYQRLSDATSQIVRFEKTFEPKEDIHNQYVSLFERWGEAYGASLELAEEGVVQPMWRAAGS